jgi:hypothetical protein
LYLSAGLAVAATPTPGQRPVIASAPDAFVTFDARDTSAFEAALKNWSKNPAALLHARVAAWEAAAERWRWDHPSERDALVRRVAEILQ